MKKKLVIGIIILLIVGALGLKILSSRKEPVGNMVTTVELERGDIESHIKSTGTIVSMDSRDVMSDVEEKIEKMYVKKGDKVSEGQVLMKLDESNIRNKIRESKIRLNMEEESLKKALNNSDFDLTIGLDNAKIRLADLDKEYQRNQELFRAGAITKVEVDRSKDARDQAENEVRLTQDKLAKSDLEIDVNMQRQRVELARIELQDLEKNLEKYVIKSPIGGTIVDTSISESGIVESHKRLMSIQDVDNLEMVVNMNEFDVGKIKEGNSVVITGDSLQGKTYKGRVTHIAHVTKASLSEAASASENTIEVKIALDTAGDSLRPGLSAKADILTDSRKNVFNLPYEAFFTRKDGGKVIFVVENGRAREIEVTTGIANEFKLETLGDLSEGMEVILNPTEDIVDGAEVTAIKES